jgi:glycosyltransferase involved in cell wall biosynthesis
MVTALARSGVEGVRLKLAGRFESESLRRDVGSLDGWRRVDAFGQVGRSQINAILATVRAGLLLLRPEPNYLASQPTKLYEYMAAGIPVIASNFGLWRDIVEREACGVLVEPRRPDAVAAAIDHLVTQDAEAEQMGVRGRAAVEKAYNWETEEQKLWAFYSTILS